MKRKRSSEGPFVMIPLKILDAKAWHATDPIARLLWIELRRKLRNDRLNNGKIYRATLVAAKAIGASKNTIVRRYAELEHYGFLRKTTGAYLGLDGRGIAPHYRFTDLMHGTQPATRDYEKWDGELFAYTPRHSRSKKQNPVPRRGTPRTTRWDIPKVAGGGAVCTTAWDIDESPKCTTAWDMSRLPVVEGMDEGIRGSPSVRAPVKAGGAGSSPAPVASDLIAMVVGMVNAQLGQLRA